MQTTIKTRLYTLVGITDERTDCDCCGRSGLKRTMVLKPTAGTSADDISSDFVFFGVNCGAKALAWAEGDKPAEKMSAAKLLKQAEAAERARRRAEFEAAIQAHPINAEIDALHAAFVEFSFKAVSHGGRHPNFHAMIAYARSTPEISARYDAFLAASNDMYTRRHQAVIAALGHRGM